MSPRIRWALTAWAFLVAATAGCSRHAADDEAETLKPVPVQAVKAETMTLRPTMELVATVIAIPERIALVSSQQGGWVEQLAVVEGQAVHKGDVLMRLDARTARANLDRAKALVSEKTAVLARLKRGYLPQEIEAARQDRDKARAARDALRTELAALKELLDRRELSPVQYETKQKALASAEAAEQSAEERVRLLEAGTRIELIEEAQAQLDAANADAEHAQLAVEWCTITSPIDGLIVQLPARQGQYLDRAAPLATVIDLREVFVQLRIPSAELGKVRDGTAVDVDVPAVAGRTFHGTVTRLSSQADALTGSVDVFATLKNDDGSLRPGLGCHARVWLPEIPEALTIPIAAVADHSGTPVVTVIRDNKAHEVKVTLGAKTRDLVQVLSGLSPGDLVATTGGYGLPEGCPVQVAQESSKPH
jgi:RND family efflux transporter MFP subunit